MPDTQLREYNPLISGFSCLQGPMNISLNEAKKQFGQFPSRYGFVPEKNKKNQIRQEKKALNLQTGHFIKALLEQNHLNLKEDVHRFFNAWHRDLDSEFGIHTSPFFNINDTRILKKAIEANKAIFNPVSDHDIKQQLTDTGLIRKDILNSIHPDVLLEKASQILQKKIKSSGRPADSRIQAMLNHLNTCARLNDIRQLTGNHLLSLDHDMLSAYTDEICAGLVKLNTFRPLEHAGTLTARKGKGVEFEYATRDDSYLKLGKKTRDCTADKRGFQSDASIENIFWTVFSWILDRNYQILNVYYNNEFVMKVHLLPLYISATGCPIEFQSIVPDRSDYIMLAVDAIETSVAFRGQTAETQNNHLTGFRDEIFSKTMAYIIQLADDMNIADIYAEKFSNTPWVRDKLNAYPEIFIHADHMIKIDQLEDVYYLAEDLSTRYGYSVPQAVFMEIQMKNTYLRPGYINKAPGVKSFGLIRGQAGDGIPMKRIIGV